MSSLSRRADGMLPTITDGLKFLLYGFLEVSHCILILVRAPMNVVRASRSSGTLSGRASPVVAGTYITHGGTQ